MRLSNTLSILLLGASIALPVRAPAQVNIGINLSRQLGPEISIFFYSQPDYGDWRVAYRQWTPITIYDFNGRYYRRSVKGARPVVVYTRNGEYFLPPQDREWIGFDKRYNYKRAPDDRDRGRARPKGPDNGRGRGRGKP
jgi:hypothetical protein